MTSKEAIAITLAREIHAGQKDQAGRDYIEHPLRVMQNAGTELERILGVLHDTLEDADDPESARAAIAAGLGSDVAVFVDRLSHKPGQSYDDYLSEVMRHRATVNVKILDVLDNISRLNLLPFGRATRLRAKYEHALLKLLERKKDYAAHDTR